MYTGAHTHTLGGGGHVGEEKRRGMKGRRKKKEREREKKTDGPHAIGQGLRRRENEFNWSAHHRPSSLLERGIGRGGYPMIRTSPTRFIYST